nr:iron permease FTR1 family [uncultured bacterium]
MLTYSIHLSTLKVRHKEKFMDFLPDPESMAQWLLHYGSFSLFILLALGVVALPIPDETLMVVAGILMKKGDLVIPSTLAASYLGSMAGITLSYLIGRTAGSSFLHRYGSRFGLTEEKLTRVHNWFEHYGKWTLTFGYFIPGIRHLTGFAAGSSELEFPRFALYAYLGAAIWATCFLSIGYFLGNYWSDVVGFIEQASDFAIFGVILAALLLFFLWWKYKKT